MTNLDIWSIQYHDILYASNKSFREAFTGNLDAKRFAEMPPAFFAALPYATAVLALTFALNAISARAQDQSTGGKSLPSTGATQDSYTADANRKLLAELVGTWNYTLKIWMGPDKPPVETPGVVVRKPIMNGRFLIGDFAVEMLPRAAGKLQKVNFEGKSIEGYDEVKSKFVSVWIDNQTTGITTFQGTYDPASHSFTYYAETEDEPGKVTKVREVITVIDSNHYRLDWYEDHNGDQLKTVEINYTRATWSKSHSSGEMIMCTWKYTFHTALRWSPYCVPVPKRGIVCGRKAED